jgi:pimeloyl-ACP methyl ester carboxylesterase
MLHVEDVGEDGMPVVFVHSYAGSSKHWSDALDHLRSTSRAITFDLRGHGASANPPDDDYSVDSLADDIEAVVDSLDLKRFVLVGHSLGAAAAITFAAMSPGRVAGLILVSTPGRLPAEAAKQVMASITDDYETMMAEHWRRLLEGARPATRTQLDSEVGSVPKDASIRLIGATVHYDPLTPLRRYPGPTLLVATPHGDIPHDLHRLLPNVLHEMIPGTSHWPHLDKPEEFSRLLDDFLAGVA